MTAGVETASADAGIAEAPVLTVGAVEKHIASILGKLRLPPSESDHRRVLAVLTYSRTLHRASSRVARRLDGRSSRCAK